MGLSIAESTPFEKFTGAQSIPIGVNHNNTKRITVKVMKSTAFVIEYLAFHREKAALTVCMQITYWFHVHFDAVIAMNSPNGGIAFDRIYIECQLCKIPCN